MSHRSVPVKNPVRALNKRKRIIILKFTVAFSPAKHTVNLILSKGKIGVLKNNGKYLQKIGISAAILPFERLKTPVPRIGKKVK